MNDLQQAVTDKFVLLDTNVLIDSAKYHPAYKSLYDELRSYNAQSLFDETVQFELRSGATSATEIKLQNQFITLVLGSPSILPPPSVAHFRMATNIARISKVAGNHEMKIGDCLIGAAIGEFARARGGNNEAFIATQNHKDFSPHLFKREAVRVVELPSNGALKVVGFYSFNYLEFDRLVNKYGFAFP